MADDPFPGRLSPNPPEGMSFWVGSLSGDECFWSIDGRWLHPVFDFLDKLRGDVSPVAGLALRDRVIGRGAAWLILETGIHDVGSTIMSRGALEVFRAHSIEPCYGMLVERVDCATEGELLGVTDRATALSLLFARRDKARAARG